MHADATPDSTQPADNHVDAGSLALLRLVDAGGALAPRRRLLEQHADPDAALRAGPAAWRAAGMDARQIAQLVASASPTPARARWLSQHRHHLIGWTDGDYPTWLRHAASPPLALFVAGDRGALWQPAIAIVGSRAATHAGREHAHDFAHALARAGICVISGLASGIDAAAHRGALEAGGISIGVVGCGPDIAYPREHAELHAELIARGAVLSEHPPQTPPLRQHFPSRNRIVAGLSLGTLVIEAADRSGALITARMAADAGREVFALPGSIRSPQSAGCHRLIRDGATLVTSPEQILDALAPIISRCAGELRSELRAGQETDEAASPIHQQGKTAASPVHPDHHRLWSALGHDPTAMDQLVERTGLTPAVLSPMLLHMELEGRVVIEHGRYLRSG